MPLQSVFANLSGYGIMICVTKFIPKGLFFMETQDKELTPQEKTLATSGIPRLVLYYSIPTIIGMLVNALYVVVDRFFVGQIPGVGSDALTGIGLAAPVINIMGAFALLVGIGTAANISIRLGNRDTEGAEQVLGNALVLNLTFPIVLSILGMIFFPKSCSDPVSASSSARCRFNASQLKI